MEGNEQGGEIGIVIAIIGDLMDLPKGWKMLNLGGKDGACEINPSKKEVELDVHTEVSFIPMSAVSESGHLIQTQMETRKLGEVKKGFTYFSERDILFAKITPCMENGKRAIAQKLKNKIGFGSTEFHILRAQSKVLPEWVYYLISSETFRKRAKMNMTGTAGQKRVPSSFLKEYKIPVPPLPTQRKIVAILEKAEAIKQKRQEAIELTNKIAQSIFLEMFGDHSSNSKKWVVNKLGDVATFAMGGTPDPTKTDYYNGSILWIKGSDIDKEFIYDVPNKISEEGLENSNARMYEPGTVLVGRTGQGKTRGRTAIMRVKASTNETVIAIMTDTNKITPEYLHYNLKLRYRELRHFGGDNTRGGITQSNLKGLPVVLPPIQLQEKFSKTVIFYEILKRKQSEIGVCTDDLFNSLMQRAFTGELVA